MPGRVVRVLVEAGQEVAEGDGVVVIEAMKMQNELKSPKARPGGAGGGGCGGCGGEWRCAGGGGVG